MKVLIVEDDQKYIDAITAVFAGCKGTPEVTSAQSKQAAEVHLASHFYDLIVLDLKIPSEDGLLDADPQNGRLAFYLARLSAPGTPIFVLTGSSAEEFIPDFLGSSQQVDVWSEGQQIQTVNFQRKLRFAEFLPAVEKICEAVWNLSEVELQLAPGCHISIEYDRLLRIFSRRYGGARCRAELVGGGLSRAKVFRLTLTSTDGSLIHNAIAKLGSIEDVREEGRRFETYVSRLGPAATPRKLHVLEHGAKMTAGVFYQLAADVHADAFSAPSIVAASVPGKLKDLFSPWREDVPETRHAIKEIRRVLLSDEDLKRILSRHTIPWIHEFEARQIQVKWCCIHGDLHGKNVLVGENGSVVVIDYGDVGQGTASLDPITFELSLHFHPEGPFKGTGWPTLDQAAQWGDLDQYLNGCPNPLLIREIRRWTDEVKAAKREVAASAYAYLIRQLKYSDNNPDLILALLNAVYLYFMST